MIVDPNELKEDILTILKERYDIDRSTALALVDDNFLEKVIDKMYEAQHNEIVWQLVKRGIT